MRKRNLILPLFLGSLFMPTTLDAALFDLYKSNNNQKSDILIASPGGHGGSSGGSTGGGGGGGQKPSDKKALEERRKPAQDAAKKRNACKKKEIDCSKKGVESNKKEKIDFGVSDEVATTLRGKSHIYLTRRINKRLKDDLSKKINVAISILKIEAGGVNNENIDQWIKKIGEYRLKISTLQDLQIRVNDFLNFNMDTNVYGMKFVDGKGDEYTNKGLRDKTRNFKKEFSALKDELKNAGFLNSGSTRLDLDYLFNRTDLFTERILNPENTNSDGKYQCKSDTCF